MEPFNNMELKMNRFVRRVKLTIAMLGMLALTLAAGGCDSSHTIEFSRTIQDTSDFIDEEMKKADAVGLSIALVSGNEIVWAEGFGWADKENEIPATADSKFMLGSGTKTLTTVTLLKLYEQGLIGLDDPIGHYLPEFTMASRYPFQSQEMTIRRLLNHHSGVPGDLYAAGFLFGESWEAYGCDLYMDYLMEYLSTDYPSHAPGEMATYSNTGFVLAGEIALRQGGLAGETFPEFMERQLFKPLGMAQTSFQASRENMALGYIGGQVSEIKQTNCTFGATGGAWTTVKDIARFLIMVNNEGRTPEGEPFLLPETVALLGDAERSELDIDSMFQPGLGLDSMDDPAMKYAGRAWMKNGGTGDYFSLMEMLPDKKLGVVVLTNSDTAENLPWAVVRECLKNAVREKYGIQPSAPALPDYNTETNPARIEGIYVKKYGYDKIIDNGDDTFTWTMDAQSDNPTTTVLTYQNGVYKADDRTESISFKNFQWNGNDYFVMIQSGSSGSDRDEYPYGGYVRAIAGEKIMPGVIPNAWSDRLGDYVYDNVAWNDINWGFPFATLGEKDGLLLWGQENTAVPQNEELAFIAGLTHRSDSSIRVIQEDGKEKLLFGGYRAYPMAQVPPIASGDVINGTVDLFKSDWFRLDTVSPGQEVAFEVTTESDCYALTLFNENGVILDREMGALSCTTQQGSYFLAISPTPDASGFYTMMVN
jgi:CubicO group peptidase (beta-lactamase class C family)